MVGSTVGARGGTARRCGALLLLVLLLPVAPADARPEARARRADPAALAAAMRFLCPHGGAPVRGLRGRCRAAPGASLAARGSEPMPPGWWDGGIAPPTHRQSPCPAGTVATAALARPDSVRCLPE